MEKVDFGGKMTLGDTVPRQKRPSPAMAGARKFLLSSSLPYCARAGVAMSVCTPIPMLTPLLRICPAVSGEYLVIRCFSRII